MGFDSDVDDLPRVDAKDFAAAPAVATLPAVWWPRKDLLHEVLGRTTSRMSGITFGYVSDVPGSRRFT